MQSLVCFLAWNRKGIEVKWKERREKRKGEKKSGWDLMTCLSYVEDRTHHR